METFTVVNGYSPIRKTLPRETVTVRRYSLEEIKNLQAGSRVGFIDNKGQYRELTINGRPKTWKTRPAEVSVPVKYGMYEYATLETAEALDRLVARVYSE